MRRSVPLDPDVRDRATVLAALARARALAGEAVSAALGLAPPLGDDGDPRWYAIPEVQSALDGDLNPDGAECRVEVALWRSHTALLTAHDLPPGVAVYLEPETVGYFRRGAPFPNALSASARRRATARLVDGRNARRPTPVEFIADLGADRASWDRELAIDTTYGVLAAAAEARARTHGDVEILDQEIGQHGSRVHLVLAVRLPPVVGTTPVDEVVGPALRVLATIQAPARRLEEEVAATVAAVHARLDATRPSRFP